MVYGLFVHIYTIARYSLIQMSELKLHGVKKIKLPSLRKQYQEYLNPGYID